jgi:hypothetical protein
MHPLWPFHVMPTLGDEQRQLPDNSGRSIFIRLNETRLKEHHVRDFQNLPSRGSGRRGILAFGGGLYERGAGRGTHHGRGNRAVQTFQTG